MRRWLVLFAAVPAILAVLGWQIGWRDLWSTPDQRGQRLLSSGRAGDAAAEFADPLRRGVAQFRAGDFKAAAASFAGVDGADALYDQGTALIMLGKYDDAIHCFDQALELRPGWSDAEANRTLATLRAAAIKQTGGDSGNTQKADEVVYDKNKQGGDKQRTETEDVAMTDQSVRALWLKRIEPRPAEFLRQRFLFQLGEQK
jgi:Ca-activated chloride channel family protein